MGEALCSLGWMMDFFIYLNLSMLSYAVKIIIKFYICHLVFWPIINTYAGHKRTYVFNSIYYEVYRR